MPNQDRKHDDNRNTGGDSRSASRLSETDLSQDIMGTNRLQGNDQSSVSRTRLAVPDVKKETDGLIESFEKLDDEVRAREDLGKGNRSRKP